MFELIVILLFEKNINSLLIYIIFFLFVFLIISLLELILLILYKLSISFFFVFNNLIAIFIKKMNKFLLSFYLFKEILNYKGY